jgi:predicted CoA-binding protein
VLAWYHSHGLPVTPINPTTAEIKLPSEGYKTVATPSALEAPSTVALSIITPPSVTRKILEEAKSIGIQAVWLQPGSFDEDGLEYAKANFKAAVGGHGGQGGEGWCILADGESALEAVNRDTKSSQKL